VKLIGGVGLGLRFDDDGTGNVLRL
jgi:hypothetical protein